MRAIEGGNASAVGAAAFCGGAAPDAAAKDRRTSSMLLDYVENVGSERVTVAELAAALGERAFGLLLLAFALPNIAPLVPPGLSTVLGLPLVLLSFQLACGRPAPWFPRMLGERSFARRDLLRMLERILPALRQVERLLRPRWTFVLGRGGERLAGGICLVLATIVLLPIPFGNILPALAISVLGLAIVEKDGLAALLGNVLALVSLAVVAAVLIALFQVFFFFLGQAFA